MRLWEEDNDDAPDITIIERGRFNNGMEYELHEEGRWTGHPLPAFYYKYKDPFYPQADDPRLIQYIVLRETPKGYWIYDRESDKERWIQKDGKKRFAYPTKEEALYSYYRKKLEHLRHLEHKHDQLKTIVRKIEHQNDIFGAQRPMLTRFTNLFDGHGTKLEPLKRLRPKKEFIEEGEMIV